MIRNQVPESAYGNSNLEIDVKCPRTHIENERAIYTDYEINIQTNHPAFPLTHSKVRRRYSEFIWLKNKLGLDSLYVRAAPRLPGKQLVGRFRESFLTERQQGLQEFLRRLVGINAFLFHPALLLFLQTKLSVKEMNYFLRSRTAAGIKSLVKVRYFREKPKEEAPTRKRLYSFEYPPMGRSVKQRHQDYGQGWSGKQRDLTTGKESGSILETETNEPRKRRYTFHGGRGILPPIPGSSENLASSDSQVEEGEEEDMFDEHPLSNSWHGTTHDEIDLLLSEEYEVIPLNAISSVEQNDDDELANDLGLLDLTMSGDNNYCQEGRFDY